MSPNPDVDFREGRRLFEERRFEESLALFARVVQTDPDRAEAHYGQGLALFNLGRLGEAEASFRAALEHNRRYADALYQLGAIAERREDWQSAIKAYSQAVAINSSHGARNRLHVLSSHASTLSQGETPSGPGVPPVNPDELAFTPAEIGTVSGLVPRSEPDPEFPLLPSFERPTVHTFNFELVRKDQTSLSVEMRGATLRGLPPRNGDLIAIPATPGQYGRYQIDRFQRLSDPRELVIMQPRVDDAAVRRKSRVAKARGYVPYLKLLWAIVMFAIVIALLAFFVPTAMQDWREVDEQLDQGFEQQRQQNENWAEQKRREAEEFMNEADQRSRDAQQQFERQRQQQLDQARADCLQSGFPAAECNRLYPPGAP